MTITGAITELERMDMRVGASPGSIPDVRHAVVDFARRHQVPRSDEIALAVTEAVTNAVIHGYRAAASGAMRIVACARPDAFVVVVRDYGVGMCPHPDSPGLGLGLSVIGRLTRELNIETPDEGGTRLRMHFAAG
jgi:anti-sigma regulatory factor (Ser/Thr protein kinase)